MKEVDMDKLYMKLADAESAAEVGGKSYMMGRLIRNCEYTPDGIAITIHMMHRFLNLLGVTDGDISAAIALDGEKLSLVRSALKEKPWPAEIKSALREIYDFFDYSVCVCVRSSAVAEDGKSHSFAGVYRSNINIRTFGEFLWAVRDCWLSAFDDNAVAYAAAVKENLSLMALTVQPLINSIKSGVAVLDNGVLTISAAYGQGHGVVSGQVASDTYKISAEGAVISSDIRRKETCYLEHIDNRPMCDECVYRRWDDGHIQGFYINSTDIRNAMFFCSIFDDENNLPESAVLSEEQQKMLAEELYRLSAQFGGGNWDFEWAFNNENKLSVLQARPLLSTLSTQEPAIIGGDENVIAYGVPISNGEVTGRAKIIYSEKDIAKVNKGDIVVIDWIPESCIGVLNTAGGLVIGDSSVLSHCAIIAREWGVPCVGGVSKTILVEGTMYRINGALGTVSLAEGADSQQSEQEQKDDRLSGECIPIMFWLVTAVDDVLTGQCDEEASVRELQRIIGKYRELREFDMTGVGGITFGNADADEMLEKLAHRACEVARANNIIVRADAKTAQLIDGFSDIVREA